MSKSNNIPVWTFGNNLIDSGISKDTLSSGGSLSTDTGLLTSFSGTEVVNHTLGKIPKIINFNGVSSSGTIINTTYGNYYNGNNKSIFNTVLSSANDGKVNMETSTSYCFYLNTSLPSYSTNYVRTYVSAVSSSNFTLIHDTSGSLSGGVIWNAFA